MNWIDIIILLVIFAAVLMGIWRGFVHETLSLLAWVASFVIARIFAPETAQWLQQYIESDSLVLLLSWLLPFLITFIIFNLFKLLLISLITLAGLRPIDRLLGGVFGALKGALLITAAVIIIQLVLSRSGEAFETDSKLVPHFQVVALWMLKTLDQETELSLDNVMGRLGKMIDRNLDNAEVDEWKEKLGITASEVKSIINDDLKLAELKALLNDPEALERIKKTLNSKDCETDNCKE